MNTPDKLGPSIFPGDIPISEEGQQIAERLRGKQLEVRLFETRHVGVPPKELTEEYGKTDLRTMEESWGTIDDNMDPTGPTPQNSADEMLVGLGPKPKFPMSLIKPNREGVTVRHGPNPYFDIVEDDYPDIRGVDQSMAAVWAINIGEGKISAPPLRLSTLTEEQQTLLGKETIMHLLNSLRDKGQAFCIAKILDLFTFDRDEATLSHIGGVNHLALPNVLAGSYGITATEIRVAGAEPAPIRVLLHEYLPPHIAIRLVTKIDARNFSYDQAFVINTLSQFEPQLLEAL